MKLIAVGTQNPAKNEAVRRAVSTIWPKAEIISVSVESGISDQPRSDEETITGAANRARAALKITGADLGIGLEGGVAETPHGLVLNGWVVTIDRKGTIGLGCSGGTLLPEQVAQKIRQGQELGPIMDELTGLKNTKHSLGTAGILTGGRIDRTEAFTKGVIYALAPFLTPELYRTQIKSRIDKV